MDCPIHHVEMFPSKFGQGKWYHKIEGQPACNGTPRQATPTYVPDQPKANWELIGRQKNRSLLASSWIASQRPIDGQTIATLRKFESYVLNELESLGPVESLDDKLKRGFGGESKPVTSTPLSDIQPDDIPF